MNNPPVYLVKIADKKATVTVAPLKSQAVRNRPAAGSDVSQTVFAPIRDLTEVAMVLRGSCSSYEVVCGHPTCTEFTYDVNAFLTVMIGLNPMKPFDGNPKQYLRDVLNLVNLAELPPSRRIDAIEKVAKAGLGCT